MDWKLLYQGRNWTEKALLAEDASSALKDTGCAMDRPAWMVSGQGMLKILRDMVLENGNMILKYAKNRHPKRRIPPLLKVSPHFTAAKRPYTTLSYSYFIPLPCLEIQSTSP